MANRKKRRRRLGPATEGEREDRKAHITALRQQGRELSEIAALYGISRERARQIAERGGFLRGGGKDPVAVVRCLRLPGVRSLYGLCVTLKAQTETSHQPGLVRDLLQELGLWEAAQRLFRLRTRQWRRTRQADCLRAVQAFIDDEGRTPTGGEFGVRAGIPGDPRLPPSGSIFRYFGSMTAFWTALGVTPRATGGTGRRQLALAKMRHNTRQQSQQ